MLNVDTIMLTRLYMPNFHIKNNLCIHGINISHDICEEIIDSKIKLKSNAIKNK
jgi:hypothetical protein